MLIYAPRPRGRAPYEAGKTYFYRIVIDADGDEIETEYMVRYIIFAGEPSSFDEEGSPGDVELDLPDDLVLTADEERDLIAKILDRHEWEH